jgi:uncharacterized membrane protein YbhN (UPF0104 family)
VVALYGVDLEVIRVTIANADPIWLTITAITFVLGLILKTVRWKLLLPPVLRSSRWQDLFGALLMGQSASILLPFRGGDVVRAGVIAFDNAPQFPVVLAGILVEKSLDLWMLTLTTLIVVPLLPAPYAAKGWIPILMSAAGLMALSLGVLLGGRRSWKMMRRLLTRFPTKLFNLPVKWGDQIVDGLDGLRSPKHLLGSMGLSVIIWGVMLTTNLAMFRTLSLQLPIQAGLLVLVLVHVGLIPALMPGNIGPFYFFARLSLTPFAIATGETVGFAVLLHAVVTLPPLLGAAVYLGLRRKTNQRQEAMQS